MPHPSRCCFRLPDFWTARLLAAGVIAALCTVPEAGAVQPKRFVHTTESDFADGAFEHTVATNLGDLKLAAAHETLGELPADVDYVYDLATVSGTTYAAVGPEGRVLVRDGDAWKPFADFADAQVFALLAHGEDLMVGVSGAAAGVHRVNAQGEAQVFTLPGETRYVWDLAPVDGKIVAATGPEGRVFAVGADGAVQEVLDTAQANVLTLAAGRGPWAGSVFAGTDTDGLVYRIDAGGRASVVYDAAEPEVSALAVAADGTLYAGTADAEQAVPGRLEEPEETDGGRPEQTGDTAEPEAPPAGAARAEAEVDAGAADPAAIEPPAEAAAETPDYDALRAEVRRRLAAAAAGRSARAERSIATPTRRAQSDRADTQGNAVYRVDPRGFVDEVFRESVMVLALALTPDDATLLIATGNEGQIYRLEPDAGETARLTELGGRQLLAVVADDDGLTVAAANPAGIHRLGHALAPSGTYSSSVLDAKQISLWGTARVSVRFPADAGLTFSTRSGNVADPEVAGWSDWSPPQPLAPRASGVAPIEATVDAPPARFLQYRVGLAASPEATSTAPVITGLSIAYVTPNLRPQLSSLTAEYPKFPGADKPASPTLTAQWEAEDANGDRLAYTLEQRAASAGDNPAPWLTLADSIDDTSFEWDTRRVPDGYYELRVSARDGADNPGAMALSAARRSDPVLVDNTAPALESVRVVVQGRTAAVTAVAVDAHSPIHSVAYRLDDTEDESPLLPDDLIYDSTREAWSIKLSNLSPGTHLLSLRVTDLRGNHSFHARRFDVE